jgi:hypothetical protein
MITLLTEPRLIDANPYSFTFSAIVHGVGIGLLFAGLVENPRIIEPARPPRQTVRLVEMHMPKPKPSDAATSYSVAQAAPIPSNDKTPARALTSLRAPLHHSPALHTLIQPDVAANKEVPRDYPLPTLLVWDPHDDAAKEIILHPHQDNQTADAVSSMAHPNEEKLLADVAITSSALTTLNQPILPSSTSPVVVHAPQPAERVPRTESLSPKPPTEATILSISDLRMTEGTAVLPHINEVASPTPQNESELSGSSQQAITKVDAGASQAGGNPSNTDGAAHSTSRIKAPQDGTFGLVVVGASPEDQFPEASGLWSGRMVYTVYLHVGTTRNWILQYSQPRSVEVGPNGNTTSLESPWPTDMVVPNLAGDAINADALMVHGVLNKEGRFEDLAVVFPTQFAMTSFVLNALKQWEFRPAVANGLATAIEVLLIIPEQN